MFLKQSQQRSLHLFLWIAVAALAVRVPAGGDPAAQTLRQAAGKRLLIGCAIATVDLQNAKRTAMIVQQYDEITPEYDLMPAHLVDDAGHYTFTDGDAIVAFAAQHHMPVLGHMLIWNFVTRQWLFQDAQGKPLPRAQALANLKGYINTVVGHYRGKIQAWNVVNEAISDNSGEYLKDTPALRAIGPEYIQKAFEYAHAADPKAELYYNDYNSEQPDKLAKTIRLVRSLQHSGVRIDAVGIQGHWLLDWPPTEMIEKGIDAIAALGVKVMITELDVDPLPRDSSGANMAISATGDNPYPDSFPPAMQAKLAQRYGAIMAAILRHPSVTMVNFWGPDDSRSWLNDYPVKGRTNYPLLFDSQDNPKPAFDAVLHALQSAGKTP
jgi:endo-1,4-beta-xylanase